MIITSLKNVYYILRLYRLYVLILKAKRLILAFLPNWYEICHPLRNYMKQPRAIQRLSSFMLATLLLFTAVWGHGNVTQAKSPLAHKAVTEQAKSGKATDAPSSAELSAAQFEAVVTPAIQLGDSGQTAFLLPAPTLVILLLLSVVLLRHFTLPHFYFSYFRHVFGHHIATNAP